MVKPAAEKAPKGQAGGWHAVATSEALQRLGGVSWGEASPGQYEAALLGPGAADGLCLNTVVSFLFHLGCPGTDFDRLSVARVMVCWAWSLRDWTASLLTLLEALIMKKEIHKL